MNCVTKNSTSQPINSSSPQTRVHKSLSDTSGVGTVPSLESRGPPAKVAVLRGVPSSHVNRKCRRGACFCQAEARETAASRGTGPTKTRWEAPDPGRVGQGERTLVKEI